VSEGCYVELQVSGRQKIVGGRVLGSRGEEEVGERKGIVDRKLHDWGEGKLHSKRRQDV